MFMSNIDSSIGIIAGSGSQEKCNYVAFADDLLLLSSIDIGVEMMLRQLEMESLKSVSSRKMCLEKNQNYQQTQAVDSQSHTLLKTAGEGNQGSQHYTDTYKYLGAEIGP